MITECQLRNTKDILTLTKNFVHYMYQYDITKSPGKIEVTDVNEDDAVYEGAKIFEIFFEGTRFKNYPDYAGTKDFEGLKPSNFGHWMYVFDRCIAELTEKSQGRPAIERWWDAIKKVILLHRSLGNEKQDRKVREQRRNQMIDGSFNRNINRQ